MLLTTKLLQKDSWKFIVELWNLLCLFVIPIDLHSSYVSWADSDVSVDAVLNF